mmetsp:Transcript_31595/g.30905  ORF Transcript_31595/g.30905 Transcript_31595/m.30905 type:complete len:127 (-) Transcript_31595:256-636(-)
MELSVNPNEEDIHQIYFTNQSMVANFHKVFGVPNEQLALRLYKIFSPHHYFRKIYFIEFLKVIMAMLYGNQYDKDKYLFNFYDFDKDGHINGVDLVNLVESVPKESLIFKEVKYISDFYVFQTMMA